MEILSQTPQKLVLKKKTGAGCLLLFSGLFTGVPLLIFTALIWDLGVLKIRCERVEPTQVNCEFNRTKLLGILPQESQLLNYVTEAKFEQIEGIDSDGDETINNQVNIFNKRGQNFVIQDSIYINGVKGNAQQMNNIESQINYFLKNINETYLILTIDNRVRSHQFFIVIFVGMFFIFGITSMVCNILMIGYEKIVFDKSTNQCEYEKVNLLGKKTETYNLTEINKIIIEEYTDSDGDNFYTLILPIRKKKHKLDSGYSNDTRQKIKEYAQKISDFLQITIEEA